ncbi:MFS transporter [bacterium]|nr:MFS transporter [bacterium]
MAEPESLLGRRVPSGARRPTLFYGWIVVGTLAITEPISWGILYYGFGVMLTPIQQEMGWSHAELTGAFSLMLLVSGIMAVPVGRWLDSHGARGLMTLGSCLAVLATIGWAQVQTLTDFYLIWMAIGVVSAMVLYEPAFAVTATWFVRQRAQALTLLTLGGGLASVIFVPLATWLVQETGWRTSLWILAVILAVTTIPLHALVLRRGPDAVNARPDGDVDPVVAAPTGAQSTSVASASQDRLRPSGVPVDVAVRTAAFWWLSVSFTFSLIASVALAVHLLPFLTGQGYSPGFAALTVSVLGGSQIPGRLVFGPLSSRFSLRVTTAFLFAMVTVGLILMLIAPAGWLVLLGASFFGMGSGASSPARAALVGDFFGVANYGAINGTMTLVLTAARAGAPLAMGVLYTWTGGYNAVFWTLIVCSALAVGSLLAARNPS